MKRLSAVVALMSLVLPACSNGTHGVTPSVSSQGASRQPATVLTSGCTQSSQPTGTITEYPLPTGYTAPAGIRYNPATGNIWVAIGSPASIGEFVGSSYTWNTPHAVSANSDPLDVTIGSDGNPWFTEFYNDAGSGKVGVLRVNNNYQLQEWSLGRAFGIDTSPLNGDIYVGSVNGYIERYDTNGPNQGWNQSPPQFEVSSDSAGNIWYSTANTSVNKVVELPASGGVKQYTVPSGGGSYGITEGPSGTGMWFTEYYGNRIGNVSPSGQMKEWNVPTASSQPEGIIAACGNLWFAETNGNKIGEITPSGTITEYPVPTANAGPSRVTVDANGTVWFSEAYGNKIASIVTNGTTPPPASPYVLTSYGGRSCGSGCETWISDELDVLNANSNGTVNPVYSLISSAFDNPVATIAPDNTMWVANSNGTVQQYPAISSAYSSGLPPPLATISGSNTQLGYATQIAVDIQGNVDVLDGSGIVRFAAGSNGNVAPFDLIPSSGGNEQNTGLTSPADIAVGGKGTVYVANRSSNPNLSTPPPGEIAIFGPGVDGDSAPASTIGGSNTLINYPSSVAVAGNVYVLCNDSWSASGAQAGPPNTPFVNPRILVFAAGNVGNVAPMAEINGWVGVNSPIAMRVDADGGIYVADYGAQTISYFAPGTSGTNVTPTRVFSDPLAQTGYGFASLGI